MISGRNEICYDDRTTTWRFTLIKVGGFWSYLAFAHPSLTVSAFQTMVMVTDPSSGSTASTRRPRIPPSSHPDAVT